MKPPVPTFENTIASVLETKQTTYLAAVSGGADSTAMLVALASLFKRGELHALHCLHVEHGIRQPQESKGDAEYVRTLCEKLGVSCRVVTIPPGKIADVAKRKGIGIEAAARQYRIRELNREARQLQLACQLELAGKKVRILTAHTRDDFLETVLMRMLRGSGPAGLAAIPHSRGRFLRPLLSLSRSDVLAYLAEKNIPWREDSTNKDPCFLRNKIRLRLVPVLNELFPGTEPFGANVSGRRAAGWQAGLSALAYTQSLAADFIGKEAARRVKWKALGNQSLETPADKFFSQPDIIREEALFQGADRLLASKPHASESAATIKRANVRQFCSGKLKAADLGRLRVCSKNGRLILTKTETPASERGFALLIKEPGWYTLKGISIEVRQGINQQAGQQAKEGECFFTRLPVVFRPAYNGDFLIKGGRKIKASKQKLCARICAASPQGIAAFIGINGAGINGIIIADSPYGTLEPMSGWFTVTVKLCNEGKDV